MFRKISIVLTVLIPCVILGWLTANPHSLWDGDTLSFLPTAVRYADNYGLTNPLYAVTVPYHGAHDGRFIWHGFISPLLLGQFSTGSYSGVLLTMALLFGISIVILSYVLYRQTRQWAIYLQVLWLGGSLWAYANFLHMNARPEATVSLWVTLALSFIICCPSTKIYSSGFFLGLIAMTSPVAGIFSGIFWLMWLSSTTSTYATLGLSLVRGSLVCLVAILLSFWWYPYTLLDWLHGLKMHSHVVTHYVGSHRFYNWFIVTPGLGVFVGLLCFLELLRICTTPQFRLMRLCLWLVCLGSIVYFAPDARNYNIKAFLPLGLVLLPKFIPQTNRVRWVCLLLLIPLSLPFVRDVVLATTAHPIPLSQVNLSSYQSSLAVSSGLLVAAPHNDVEILIPSQYENGSVQSQKQYFILQQINPWKDKPPVFSNYKLIANNFTPDHPKIFGIPIANSPRGFNYAVYEHIVP